MNLCYKTLGDRRNNNCKTLVDPHLERYLKAEGSHSANFSSRLAKKLEYIYRYTYISRSSKYHFPAMVEQCEICHFYRNNIETNLLMRSRALLSFPSFVTRPNYATG